MNALAGVIFHFIGGFASGSFYVPYKKVKGWSWESMWILGGLFSWIIVPPIAAWLTIPNFADIISNTDSSIGLYLFIRDTLGDRRIDLWSGGTIFGCFFRKQCDFGIEYGLRIPDACSLLFFQ
jgi:hypothetical protein